MTSNDFKRQPIPLSHTQLVDYGHVTQSAAAGTQKGVHVDSIQCWLDGLNFIYPSFRTCTGEFFSLFAPGHSKLAFRFTFCFLLFAFGWRQTANHACSQGR